MLLLGRSDKAYFLLLICFFTLFIASHALMCLPSGGADFARTHTHADRRRGSGWSRARNAQPHGDVVQQVRCLR